jgi:hypothetical protein
MKAGHIAAALIGIALVASPVLAQDTTTSTTAPPQHRRMGINAREHRQAERIKDGKQDGQLTKGELDKLKADEAAVRAEERVYRKSGGGLNQAERKDLEKDLNKTSREIYRAKHNGRKPR